MFNKYNKHFSLMQSSHFWASIWHCS